ncbi:MAG: hypothetical protein ACXW3J_00540 [Methylocystis sp.]
MKTTPILRPNLKNVLLKVEMLLDPPKMRFTLADEDAVPDRGRMIFDHRSAQSDNLLA